MKISFFGGAKSVTGANYLLETKKTKILIDCGMFQGGYFNEEKNYEPFLYDPKTIDAVCLTHAHIDHSGRLPKLYRDGFLGKTFGTPPTRDFSNILLLDSLHIIQQEVEKTGRMEAFYEAKDIENFLEHFSAVEYNQKIKISNDISIRLQDAGHILGSSIIEVFVKEESKKEIKIVFSGDLGNPPTPILRPTKLINEADYLLIESAYGDRIHENQEERKKLLQNTIIETINKKGVLLIPSFAIERTQEMLYELNDLIENKHIPPIPVFIDSPLAIRATEIYKKYQEYYNEWASYLIKSGDDLFKFPGLKFTLTTEESKAINNSPSPKIIIAGSGMLQAGRMIYHLKRYLYDEKNTLLIIGFQPENSLGKKLLNIEKEKKDFHKNFHRTVKIYGDEIEVNAKIKAIGGYSAHADQPRLLNWTSQMKKTLKNVFIVQGEEKASNTLAQKINSELRIKTMVPDANQTIEIN